MMRSAPSLFVLFLVFGPGPRAVFAENIWVVQTTVADYAAPPLPVDPRVQFFGIAQGWALDASGRLLKTTDGGATWVEKTRPPVDDPQAKLNSLHFINPDTGWVTNRARETYRTYNGGNSWQKVGTALGTGSPRIFFVDTDTGWAVGDNISIYRTVDGGTTWTEKNVQRLWQPRGIFHRAGTAWVLDYGHLFKNVDGENVWSESLVRTGLNSVYFANDSTGWVVGDTGIILKTTDGITWEPQSSGTLRNLSSVHFVSADTGWIVGDSGTTLSTTNGGANWTTRSGGTTENLIRTWFVNGRTGWALGTNGLVYRTADADVPVGVRKTTSGRRPVVITAGKLHYHLRHAGRVTIVVHALDGAREALLHDGTQSAGPHSLDLASRGLSPGLHLLSFEDREGRTVKALILP